MARPFIEVNNLRCALGGQAGIDYGSFSVHEGEVLALLGPNGSGKTTLLLLLMGLLQANAGSLRVGGLDPLRDDLAIKAFTGYLAQTPFFYDHLSGAEHLHLAAQLHALPARERRTRIPLLLDTLGLLPMANERLATYSEGMQRLLSLACALVHRPVLLLLDEPTAGLDPRQARLCRDLLRAFTRGGGTVVLATHLLDTARDLATQLLVLDRQQVVARGQPDQLLLKHGCDGLEALYRQVTSGRDGPSPQALFLPEEKG